MTPALMLWRCEESPSYTSRTTRSLPHHVAPLTVRRHPLFRYFALARFSLITPKRLPRFLLFFRESPLYPWEVVYEI